jgi:hypothetical protein
MGDRRGCQSRPDPGCCTFGAFHRVELLASAALSGWYIPSKAKYQQETDSEQVPRGKDEKNFEKRVQRT